MTRARWLGSLRFRVMLLTASVSCGAVAVVGVYFARLGTTALRMQVGPPDPVAFGQTGAALVDAWPNGPSAIREVLRRSPLARERVLVVFDSTGAHVASAPVDLGRVGMQVDPSGVILEWTQAAPVERMTMRQRTIVAGTVRIPLVNADSVRLGVLVEVPQRIALNAVGEVPAARALRRSLAVGILAALVGTLLVALLLSAKVVRPLERLTQAVRTATPVGAARSDEIEALRMEGATEITELASAFEGLLAERARHDALRRGMTGDIAHELRTPVTNLRCLLESVQDGVATASPETLTALHDEVLLLQRLIDDLQELTLAEQGRLSLDFEPVDLSDELARAAAPFVERGRAAGVTVEVRAEGGLVVRADRARVRQVLGNLLTNALTYTPSGGRVFVEAAGDGEQATIEVRDTGGGVTPEDLPHLFERFYRADRSRTRGKGGAGLGLAIVGELVRLQGGVVEAGVKDGGLCVCFTLPLHPGAGNL